MQSVWGVSLFALGMESNLYWNLPLAIVLISLVYSATRYDDWKLILKESFRWGLRLFGFLAAVIVVLLLINTIG